MPITVQNLFESHDLPLSGPVDWREDVHVGAPAFYVVSLSPDPSQNLGLRDFAPLEPLKLVNWIEHVQYMKVDEKTPRIQDLSTRLSDFWLPDENILFIDLAPVSLGSRIEHWKNQVLGDPLPLRDGYWLKALKSSVDLYVYYARTREGKWIKESLLSHFMEQVSPKSRELAGDKELPLPFANLRITSHKSKRHGITGMTR